MHPVIFCGLGANAAAAALGTLQAQPHGDVLRSYMSKVRQRQIISVGLACVFSASAASTSRYMQRVQPSI